MIENGMYFFYINIPKSITKVSASFITMVIINVESVIKRTRWEVNFFGIYNNHNSRSNTNINNTTRNSNIIKTRFQTESRNSPTQIADMKISDEDPLNLIKKLKIIIKSCLKSTKIFYSKLSQNYIKRQRNRYLIKQTQKKERK